MSAIPFRVVVTIVSAIWLIVTAFVIFSSQPIVDNIVSLSQIIFYLASLFMIKTVYDKCNSITRRPLSILLIAICLALATDLINYCVLFIFHHPNFFLHDFSQLTISKIDRILHVSDYVEMFVWYIIILVFLINLIKSFYTAQSRHKIQFCVFATFLGVTLVSLLYLSQPGQLKNADFFALTAFFSSIIEIATFIVAIYGIINSRSLSLYLLLSSMILMIFTQISALFYYSYPIQIFLKLAYIAGPLWVMLMFLAFYYMESKKDYDLQKWFVVPNTLEANLAFSTLVITNTSFILFFILAYFLNLINDKNLLSFFLFIIYYSLVAVLAAKRIALFFTKPFQQLQINIGKLIASQAIPDNRENFNLEEFNFLQNFIYSRFMEYDAKVKKIQAMAQLSVQVAHDIRSPLAAINTAVSNTIEIPEKRRIMLRNAAKRINDIANNLLSQTKMNHTDEGEKNSNAVAPELIFVVLDCIVSEKNYEYSQTKAIIQLIVSTECYNCFANINITSFKRVLSNLINNSIEASIPNASVIINLISDTNYIKISVQDNGCGIPPEVLPKITEQGFSFNKKNGNGFGLSYAKQYIAHLHGKLSIDSKVNIGTKITISLPKSNIPDWFCETIKIKQSYLILVLDDDISIHDAWDERFNGIPEIKIRHFYKASDLTYDKINEIDADLCLIDYELLADEKTGLDVIEELKLNKKSILVTSCFDDVTVRVRCEKLGIKIIPKSYVPYIQIISMSNESTSEIVLIDNDELIRMAWQFAAESTGVTISIYASVDDFMKEISNYKKDTCIYIDSDLGDGIKGEEHAKKIFDLGFSEIFLATGYASHFFPEMPWVKLIVSKVPPFFNEKNQERI